jgi:hydrogenase maturation protein HypF
MTPKAAGRVARTLEINGIVQGVGFRPFVFQLAFRHRLAGTVANTASGVRIHIEGPPGGIDGFYTDLTTQAPPLAAIVELAVKEASLTHARDFVIAKSDDRAEAATLISPDVTVCGDCRRELFDPQDRRYGYPFINCTNCGPRYTIIESIPYDRPKTSMRAFPMCARCQEEYDRPEDRRFHAQPNACWDCGPQLVFCDDRGQSLAGTDPVGQAVDVLAAGGIVAIKGLGGFHLAVDARHQAAVARLRRRKRREEKPFALMAADVTQVRRFAHVLPEEALLLSSIQRPIVLLSKRSRHGLSEAVAPGNRFFGVMLPYTPLHYLLFDAGGFDALVMTSANLSDEPICIDNREAFDRLAGIADAFLVHNRDILQRADDSIVRWSGGTTGFIRRSRGYVPVPVFLDVALPPLLACGGSYKNTICLTRGRQAFLGQHVGDLENEAALAFFEETVAHLTRLLAVSPEAIAHDLHPDYLSTVWATSQTALPTIGIQHHHAHIASVMAENHLDGPVIGLALDGTGYGTDGRIWGGEVFVGTPGDFQRAAHLEYAPMPGGAAAVREPWRMALSYLIGAYGDGIEDLPLALLNRVGRQKIEVVARMVARGLNCPETSSLGRLFDGIAALLGIRDRVTFEGQAAMALEMVSGESDGRRYPFAWSAGPVRRVSLQPIIRGVVSDLMDHTTADRIAARFHDTLIRGLADLCREIGRESGLARVALSGGVFQNHRLLNGLKRRLEEIGFAVYIHTLVPSNDGGLALGQAVIAARQMTSGRRSTGSRPQGPTHEH